VKRAGSAADPLWFKDAIIYELHVRAFSDSNADGVGDFQGLMGKLDYLQDLGVTCIWLLPFFPSPMRDDGYDISDYLNVNPSYGTIDDFKAFLAAAHERDLQVMIELVINHTSDQHPWFQAARKAPPGSEERGYYVWSDTDQKYQGARIIFTDTEKSNWTWDPVAKQYFWHRFFSHQPDLNFDNPRVVEEVLSVMRYWLDLGVDGLRMDAIPYLVERDATSCENLPETHRVIKDIRRAIDIDYSSRMILAEANQWPSDVRPYFGDGDECHMAFHFPLMPRIYMALRQEDRLPITDIMAQTPDIPETCQWGLFLRNHDELTLEMVTNDERDYMYLAYSADPRTRINLGIRRRLAPLMDNNRRRIELLHSLLFSFPGSPIIYYGDEIGMGDNVYLGDRNGVRTPMQWNQDRNAGFSRANPAMLYSPIIMDPVWGYEAVNVEAEQSDPSSLLSWMRNMIALRKLFRVFGRGTLEFLNPDNRKVLAYLRRLDDEQVLCVTNLSRFAQPVDLDLSKFAGMIPVEMLGYVEFPAIGRQPYRLTLGAYGFLWLELHGAPQPVEVSPAESDDAALRITGGWASVFGGPARHRLETSILPEYLPRQRWFGAKSRRIKSGKVLDWAEFQGAVFTFVEVQYEAGDAETYLVPLAMSFGKDAEHISAESPTAILCPVASSRGDGVLHDAVQDNGFCSALLDLIAHKLEVTAHAGRIVGIPSARFADLRGTEDAPLALRRSSAEQSNSSIIFGDRLILKLFRRQQAGPNPDVEIGRYLTEVARYDRIPPFGATIEYEAESSSESSRTFAVAIVQGLVANEGDGWNWTLEEVERYYENCARVEFPGDLTFESNHIALDGQPVSQVIRDYVGGYMESAATLGRRTAELHLALATPADDPAFTPEPFSGKEIETWSAEMREDASRAFATLKEGLPSLPDEVLGMAGLVLGRRKQVLERIRIPGQDHNYGQRIRIHGDYHLGQVLRVKADFVILDFEGEPARPLAERRAKVSPLVDIAGMLRSFSYAANSTLITYTTRHAEDVSVLEPWARLWERAVAAEFLRAYRTTAGKAAFLPETPEDFQKLLGACTLHKALYELAYELNNRPAWVRIPLAGILSISV
jgi:maltose alpha-D-glucosyltransferase/alpha-amylase